MDKAWVAAFEKPKTDPSAFEKPATTVLSPYLKFGCVLPQLALSATGHGMHCYNALWLANVAWAAADIASANILCVFCTGACQHEFSTLSYVRYDGSKDTILADCGGHSR